MVQLGAVRAGVRAVGGVAINRWFGEFWVALSGASGRGSCEYVGRIYSPLWGVVWNTWNPFYSASRAGFALCVR
eukprot:3945526-Prymnesium_polylepis.1